MSFGWKDKEHPGFDVRIFQSADTAPDDGMDIVAEDVISPHKIGFSVLSEIPTLSDLPPELGDHPPDDFFEYRPPDYDDFSPLPDDRLYTRLIHVHGSKLGGFPSWVQDPEWPSASDGRKMAFVGQLDYVLGENAAWGGGGYAYLFVGYQRDTPHEGELVILTT
jgi:hypothetical protein